MTAEQLAKFRERLDSQRTGVIINLEEHGDRLKQTPTGGDRFGDELAQQLENQHSDVSIFVSEENLLHKIEHALERIDAGTYGICEVCDQQIPLARLDAKPSVTLCIRCQEIHERGIPVSVLRHIRDGGRL